MRTRSRSSLDRSISIGASWPPGGRLLEFAGRPNNPPVVRSLGTTFAKVEGGNGAGLGLFASKGSFPGEPPTVLDWSGEDNEFVGWPAWLTAGSDSSARVAGLDGVKSTWPGSDVSSREITTPWPAPIAPTRRLAVEFAELAPLRKPTLLKIATPHPRFRDLTFGSLAPLVTPELSADPEPRPMCGAAAARPGIAPPLPVPKANVIAPPEPNATGPKPKFGPATKKGAPMPKGAAQAPAALRRLARST